MDDYENLYFGQKNCITKENRKKPFKKKLYVMIKSVSSGPVEWFTFNKEKWKDNTYKLFFP